MHDTCTIHGIRIVITNPPKFDNKPPVTQAPVCHDASHKRRAPELARQRQSAAAGTRACTQQAGHEPQQRTWQTGLRRGGELWAGRGEIFFTGAAGRPDLVLYGRQMR